MTMSSVEGGYLRKTIAHFEDAVGKQEYARGLQQARRKIRLMSCDYRVANMAPPHAALAQA